MEKKGLFGLISTIIIIIAITLAIFLFFLYGPTGSERENENSASEALNHSDKIAVIEINNSENTDVRNGNLQENRQEKNN